MYARFRFYFSCALLGLMLHSSLHAHTLRGDVQLSVKGFSYTRNQAANPQQDFAEVASSKMIWLTPQGRFKQITSALYPGEIEFRYLWLGDVQGASIVDLLGWRDGTQLARIDDKTAQIEYANFMFLSPVLIGQTAKHRALMVTPAELQAQFQFESFEDSAGRPATMVVHKASGEILSARSVDLVYEYASQAHTTIVKRGDQVIAKWNDVQVTPVAHIDEHEWQIPSGFQEGASVGTLRVTRLAPDTYRIDGSRSDYRTHFIVGEKSVVLFDVPRFPDEFAQVKALIERTAQAKKLTHIVLSHTHGDHIAGIPHYLSDDVQILTGRGGAASIRRQFDAKTASKVQELNAATTIDLGGRMVQIFPAPSSHAQEMLLAYDSLSGILFQGDFFMMPDQGPAPCGFPVNQELHDYLQALQIKPLSIVSVHGRLANHEELEQTVRLRQK